MMETLVMLQLQSLPRFVIHDYNLHLKADVSYSLLPAILLGYKLTKSHSFIKSKFFLRFSQVK